eukprot:4437141-Pyramimonas_sp.AAC.1
MDVMGTGVDVTGTGVDVIGTRVDVIGTVWLHQRGCYRRRGGRYRCRPAPGDGGGRGDGEVLHLEDHVHGATHLDDLAVGEAELLVVVQHGVHVLDPNGVHRAVQQHPLAVARGVVREGAELVAQHAYTHS